MKKIKKVDVYYTKPQTSPKFWDPYTQHTDTFSLQF